MSVLISTAEFDCRGVSLFPVRTEHQLVAKPMMGEIEGMKTTSKCQFFWNLRKRFSLEKKSVFLFARKNNSVLHLSLCSWKCVFAGFLEVLICNILFKVYNRETKFMHNVFQQDISGHWRALTRLPSFKNRHFVELLTCVWKSFGINQTIKNR